VCVCVHARVQASMHIGQTYAYAGLNFVGVWCFNVAHGVCIVNPLHLVTMLAQGGSEDGKT